MTYNILATGSTGNATIINDSILVDIGITMKQLRPYADYLKLVLLTHTHGDHFKPATVRALARKASGAPLGMLRVDGRSPTRSGSEH